MIVDDSPSVRRVMSNLIKGASWTPLTAKDGLDAIEMLRSATSLPDVVLTDIEMPRMDGYELLAALKANEVLARLPGRDDHLARRRQAPPQGARQRRRRLPDQAVQRRPAAGDGPPHVGNGSVAP